MNYFSFCRDEATGTARWGKAGKGSPVARGRVWAVAAQGRRGGHAGGPRTSAEPRPVTVVPRSGALRRARTPRLPETGRSRSVSRPTYTRAVDYLVALVPSLGTGLLFYFVIRAFVNADRNEREALRRLDEQEMRKGSEQLPGA